MHTAYQSSRAGIGMGCRNCLMHKYPMHIIGMWRCMHPCYIVDKHDPHACMVLVPKLHDLSACKDTKHSTHMHTRRHSGRHCNL